MILRRLICLIFIILSAAPAGLFSASEAIKNEPAQLDGFRRVEYKADELRDPFRAPFSFNSPEGENVVTNIEIKVPALKFQGVIWGGDVPLVIINDKILGIGDSVEDCRIIDINKEG